MSDIFFAAEIDQRIPTIDLHRAQNISTALEIFEQELYTLSQDSEILYVRVIHGIGSGALYQALERVLKNHPLIGDFKKEVHGGSTIVIL